MTFIIIIFTFLISFTNQTTKSIWYLIWYHFAKLILPFRLFHHLHIFISFLFRFIFSSFLSFQIAYYNFFIWKNKISWVWELYIEDYLWRKLSIETCIMIIWSWNLRIKDWYEFKRFRKNRVKLTIRINSSKLLNLS